MRRMLDWLFLSDWQYFDKYVLPMRLGMNPAYMIRNKRPGRLTRFLVWVLAG